MVSYLIQFGITIMGLIVSTVIAWYEVSAIIDNPWVGSIQRHFLI
ncbi:hypothetical protein [Peribacillus butanolivorans]